MYVVGFPVPLNHCTCKAPLKCSGVFSSECLSIDAAIGMRFTRKSPLY